jgi:hypothetical protein
MSVVVPTVYQSSHHSVLMEEHVDKKKVFVSFDFDNDRSMRDFIVNHMKREDSPFEVIDYSLKEEAPSKTWLDKARLAISRSELVIVMLGSKTRKTRHGLDSIDGTVQTNVCL